MAGNTPYSSLFFGKKNSAANRVNPSNDGIRLNIYGNSHININIYPGPGAHINYYTNGSRRESHAKPNVGHSTSPVHSSSGSDYSIMSAPQYIRWEGLSSHPNPTTSTPLHRSPLPTIQDQSVSASTTQSVRSFAPPPASPVRVSSFVPVTQPSWYTADDGMLRSRSGRLIKKRFPKL